MSYIFLFATGFLLSRLNVRYGLAESIFARLFHNRRHSFIRFLLYLAPAAAFMAMFMPNFIAALTLLPILEAVRLDLERRREPAVARRLTTVMAIIAMYGCNIGGMGSLVGSPANALIIGAIQILEVPGGEKINFLSWFGWSLPLVAILLLLAWTQISYIFVPAAERHQGIDLPPFRLAPERSGFTRFAWRVVAFWFGFWMLHSVLQLLLPQPSNNFSALGLKLSWSLWDQIAAGFGLGFLTLLFAPLYPEAGQKRKALLKISDCFHKLPVAGFVFVLLALGLSAFFIFIEAPQWLAKNLGGIIPRHMPRIVLYFFLAFITTLATEPLSNTTVSVVLFPLVHELASSLGLNPLVALIAVGLASTNAFMLPIATPANALIYGGVKHVSLPLMIVSGFLMNLMSSLCLAVFLRYVIPWYYGF